MNISSLVLQLFRISKTKKFIKVFNNKVIRYEMLLIVIEKFNKETDNNIQYIKLRSLIIAFRKNVNLIPHYFGDELKRNSLINNLIDIDDCINESYKKYIKHRKRRIRSATI